MTPIHLGHKLLCGIYIPMPSLLQVFHQVDLLELRQNLLLVPVLGSVSSPQSRSPLHLQHSYSVLSTTGTNTYIFAPCSRQNDAHQHVYILIPIICEYIRLHGKGELREQTELIILYYSGGPNVITRAIQCEESSRRSGVKVMQYEKDWTRHVWL